jgi:hypothetical protein
MFVPAAEVPSEPVFDAAITPAEIVVKPAYELLANNVSVAEPDLVSAPDPEITPDSVWVVDDE